MPGERRAIAGVRNSQETEMRTRLSLEVPEVMCRSGFAGDYISTAGPAEACRLLVLAPWLGLGCREYVHT